MIGDLNSNANVFGTVLSDASVSAEIHSNGILGDTSIQNIVIQENPNIPIATRSELGGVIVGDHLSITETGVLSVVVAQSPLEDNTNPITAAAVYTEIGNINALLATI